MTPLEEYKKLYRKFWCAAPEDEGYISIEMDELFQFISPVKRRELVIWEEGYRDGHGDGHRDGSVRNDDDEYGDFETPCVSTLTPISGNEAFETLKSSNQ